MTIKKTAIATSLLLAMGFSAPGFAETSSVMVDGNAVECVPVADIEAMTEEDKAKLTLPVCEVLIQDGATAQ